MLKQNMKKISKNAFLSKVSYSVLAIACLEQTATALTTSPSSRPTDAAFASEFLHWKPKVLKGSVSHFPKGQQMIIESKEALARVQYNVPSGGVFLGAQSKIYINQDKSATFIMETTDMVQAKVMGEITSPGNLVMAFPGGLLFGDGSKLDVNSLVVAAARIDDSALNQGQIKFQVVDPKAMIIHQGQVNVSDRGLAAFVGPVVAELGLVIAKAGQAHFETGQAATVDFNGDGLINFQVTSNEGKALLEKATQTAQDLGLAEGIVLLSTDDAISVLKNLVSTDIVEGRIAKVEAGDIVIGGNNAVVNVSPNTVIRAEQSNGDGGNVAFRGQVNTIYGTVDVSSTGKGGKILLGGDLHGGRFGPDYQQNLSELGVDANTVKRIAPTKFTIKSSQNADVVTLKPGATLNASGDQEGGKIVAWSEDATTAEGSILTSSKFGISGDTEVSSKGKLDPRLSNYDNSGALGQGLSLWDPDNIAFVTALSDAIVSPPWAPGAQ